MRVFTGLTMLDTVQATVGEIAQIQDVRTEHEEAVYTRIAFMQSVHAPSYSSVVSTPDSTQDIDDAYRWAVDNDLLRRKQAVQRDYSGCKYQRAVDTVTP